MILAMSILSTHGMPEMMAPTATMVSHFSLIIAAGAILFFASLYRMYDPTVEPLP